MKCYFLLARAVLNVDNVKMWGESVLSGDVSPYRVHCVLSARERSFISNSHFIPGMVRRPYPNIFVRMWSPDYAPYFFVTLRIAGL